MSTTLNEKWIVPRQHMEKLIHSYKEQLTSNPKLTKAAKLAAEKHLLLHSDLHPAFVAAVEKPLSSELQQLPKEIRQFPAPGGVAPGAPGDYEDLATPPIDRLLQQLMPGAPKAPRKKGPPETPRTWRIPVRRTPVRQTLFPREGSTPQEQAERIVEKAKTRLRTRKTEAQRLRAPPGWLPFDSRKKRR